MTGYIVWTPTDRLRIEASGMDVSAGVLTFYREGKSPLHINVVEVFAPGAWVRCTREDDE